MSVTLRDANVSMVRGDSRSMDINLPANTILHATYVEQDGVVTNISHVVGEEQFASSVDGTFVVNLSSIEYELKYHGYGNFLRELGHYQMTLVLDGVRFELSDNGVKSTPAEYTVSNFADSISGLGLQGYVTLEK